MHSRLRRDNGRSILSASALALSSGDAAGLCGVSSFIPTLFYLRCRIPISLVRLSQQQQFEYGHFHHGTFVDDHLHNQCQNGKSGDVGGMGKMALNYLELLTQMNKVILMIRRIGSSVLHIVIPIAPYAAPTDLKRRGTKRCFLHRLSAAENKFSGTIYRIPP